MTALLGTVDILGPSAITDCNENPTASIPTPPAGTLIVVAMPACKTYDAVPFSGGNGVAYVGFLNGDTPAVLGGTLSYGGSSQGARDVGSYTIVPGGLTSDTYTISYLDSTLTISQASLPILIDTSACSAGAATMPASVGVTKASVTSTSTTTINTSATNISANAPTATTVAGSYNITLPGDTLATISPTTSTSYTTPTITSSTYPALDSTVGTITVPSATTTSTYSGAVYTGATITMPSTSISSPSFATIPTGTITVAAVCVGNGVKVYNSGGTTSSGTVSGFVGGESVVTTTALSTTASLSVVYPTISGSGTVASNYSITSPTNATTYTVTPVQLTSP